MDVLEYKVILNYVFHCFHLQYDLNPTFFECYKNYVDDVKMIFWNKKEPKRFQKLPFTIHSLKIHVLNF